MTPLARDIINEVAQEFRLEPARILGRTRISQYMHARIAIARRLFDNGYTMGRIAKVLNRDRTTVLFYLGRTAKNQPRPLKWKIQAPRVERPRRCKDLKVKRPSIPKPKLYLVPYAGAGAEYVWTKRERA